MATKKEKDHTGEIAVNKKAKFNFELLEFFEAGIMLQGSEVKSLREKNCNLTDAFAKIKKGELYLENFNIVPYHHGGYANHLEIRSRKLLMHRKEIMKMERSIKEKGLVLVAVKAYFNDRQFVKIQLALGKPKKLHDKRDTIQTREAKIEIERGMKRRDR